MFRTIDGGLTWSPQVRATTQNLHGISFGANNTGVAVGEQGTILRTMTGGLVWNDETIQPSPVASFWFSGVSLSTSGAGVVVGKLDTLVGIQGLETRSAILRTVDGGASWVRLSVPWKQWLTAVSFGDQNTVTAVGDSGIIVRSTDGGSTWSSPQGGIPKIRLNGVFSLGANTTIAVGDSGSILCTNDGGVNWTSQRSGTTNRLSDVWFFSTASGLVIGDYGTLLRTMDGGATWFPQSSGTRNALHEITFNRNGIGLIAGDNGTILRTNISNLLSPVEGPHTSTLPNQFDLAQNYPNPFNPSTAISFQLSAVSFVTLEVFDILGRRVATLVDAMRSPGAHVVQWDGSGHSSGVYFYRLRARDASTGSERFVETKKMLLIR